MTPTTAEVDPNALTLFDTEPIYVASTGGETIDERFQAFRAANPWVEQALVRLTRDMVARGHDTIGMKMLFEVLRWQVARGTTADDFKLNNSYSSRYARLLTDEYGLDVFRLRVLTAA